MTYSAANHSTITNQQEATNVSTLEPKDSLKAESSKSKNKGKKRVTKVA
ncbi:hypothetical protein GLP27_17665, partial [Photobacterium carnosum]|nr:hypothetical protein [Photobacterium carnosum]MCD9535389.1 hypothetical protein [Photobacterium carnosum]